MDEREAFKAAFATLVEAQAAFDAWIRKAMSPVPRVDRREGQRLAEELQRKHEAFMQAARPFLVPK